METMFLAGVQFVSDYRHLILPGFLALMIIAVLIDVAMNTEEIRWYYK